MSDTHHETLDYSTSKRDRKRLHDCMQANALSQRSDVVFTPVRTARNRLILAFVFLVLCVLGIAGCLF